MSASFLMTSVTQDLRQTMRIYCFLVALALCMAQLVLAQDVKPPPYIEAGIPAVTRNWTGADYAQAVRILASGTVPLPRFSDKYGAAILERVTATENFSFYRNHTLQLQVRLEDYLTFQQSVNSLGKLYFSKSLNSTDPSKTEVAALLAYLLQTSVVGLELVDEFLPTVKKDEKYAARMEGLRTMKSGLTTVFVGSERALTENNGFSSRDRSILLKAMAETLPTLKSAFPSDYKFELRWNLRAVRTRFDNPDDRRHIDEMLRELGS